MNACNYYGEFGYDIADILLLSLFWRLRQHFDTPYDKTTQKYYIAFLNFSDN